MAPEAFFRENVSYTEKFRLAIAIKQKKLVRYWHFLFEAAQLFVICCITFKLSHDKNNIYIFNTQNIQTFILVYMVHYYHHYLFNCVVRLTDVKKRKNIYSQIVVIACSSIRIHVHDSISYVYMYSLKYIINVNKYIYYFQINKQSAHTRKCILSATKSIIICIYSQWECARNCVNTHTSNEIDISKHTFVLQ